MTMTRRREVGLGKGSTTWSVFRSPSQETVVLDIHDKRLHRMYGSQKSPWPGSKAATEDFTDKSRPVQTQSLKAVDIGMDVSPRASPAYTGVNLGSLKMSRRGVKVERMIDS